MEGRRPHLHVVGLKDDAALIGPEALQPQDQILEGRRPSGFLLLGDLAMS